MLIQMFHSRSKVSLVQTIETEWTHSLLNMVKSEGRVKRFWYLSPMRATKVQASLRIGAVSPEPPLLAHTSSESRGTFRQKARSLAPLNGWASAVKICHDGMLEDTNSLDSAQWDTCHCLCYHYITHIAYQLNIAAHFPQFIWVLGNVLVYVKSTINWVFDRI